MVTVRIAGGTERVPWDSLVVGDVIELEAGDTVPADSRLLEAENLEVDESSITGESLPVAKSVEATPGAPVPDRFSMLFEGASIAAGAAVALVVAVGVDTETGRSALAAGDPPASGVEQRLRHLTRMTLPVSLVGGAAVTGLGLLRGQPTRAAVGTGVSLMVAAVPEGLPALATLAQVAAARRLAGNNALVRNPRALEALGRVDQICFDKTGTLTQNSISLVLVSDGTDGQPSMSCTDGRSSHSRCGDPARRRPPTATGCFPMPPTRRSSTVPARPPSSMPTASPVGSGSTRSRSSPAAATTRSSAGIRGGKRMISRQGSARSGAAAVQSLASWRLDHATRQGGAHGPSRRGRPAGPSRAAVLAVAEADRRRRRPSSTPTRSPCDLELIGFVALADPVRPSAAAALRDVAAAGVHVAMITGDHASTAEAIAAELGMLNGGRVHRRRRSRAAGRRRTRQDRSVTSSVFARVTPSQKVRIVESYQRIGRSVAMTGDGANDAAAIRLADAGIALGGGTGNAAARAVADVVVTDDRIETIVDAIVEGRAMWESVRSAVAILVGGNLGEIGFILAGTAIAGSSPINARQLLLVNLLTDMAPALAIALREPPDRTPERLLHEGPDASLGDSLLREIAIRAGTTAVGATAAWTAASLTGTPTRARTVALAGLVGTQLAQTAGVRWTQPDRVGCHSVERRSARGHDPDARTQPVLRVPPARTRGLGPSDGCRTRGNRRIAGSSVDHRVARGSDHRS